MTKATTTRPRRRVALTVAFTSWLAICALLHAAQVLLTAVLAVLS